jgi:pyruvate,water dikinase
VIYSWSDAFAAGAAVVGGKGWNLGRLARYGFPIPRGCVVTERNDVREALAQFDLQQVAVRSSAASEDGASHSFAGMHDSVLNVRGVEEAEHAYDIVDASLRSERARAYRQRAGIGEDEFRSAVVLCEMVPAVCAGVAFSADPRTGRRDRVVINAVHGLADKLVAGEANPEELIVEHGATSMRVAERSGPRVLSDERALQLAALALRVESALGEGEQAQDIEWVFDGERFVLVQARPVTALPYRTFEAIADRPPIWSNANLKDVLPGVISTMSFDTVRMMIGHMLLATQESAGYVAPRGMQLLRRFSGRAYFDLAAMQWAFYDAFGVLPAETNAAIGGHQPEIDVPPEPLKGAAGKARSKRVLRLLRLLLTIKKKLPPAIESLRATLAPYTRETVRTMSDERLIEAMHEIRDAAIAYSRLFQITTGAPGLWQRLLNAQLAPLFGERANAIASGLVSGRGGVTTAEQGYALYDVAAAPDREAALQRYLVDYGHRAVYESEIANVRWSEDDSFVREQLAAIVANPPDVHPRELAARRHLIAEDEVRKATVLRRPLIRWAARKFQEAMGLREFAKSELVRVTVPTRAILLEVARRFALENIFLLSTIELEALLRGELSAEAARVLIADRAKLHEQWSREAVPDVIESGATARKPAVASTAKDGWRGVAVSSGVARGAAKILRHPSEAAKLNDGDILLAPSTDPGWTTLFLRASAIVMEVGGYLSHGAIVAREFGIPAVVNVPGILELVRDGEQLVVDGDRGLVSRA